MNEWLDFDDLDIRSRPARWTTETRKESRRRSRFDGSSKFQACYLQNHFLHVGIPSVNGSRKMDEVLLPVSGASHLIFSIDDKLLCMV